MITAEKQFTTGENFYSQHLLGAHRMKAGYVFRVWAPNAQNVWLVGDFNQWDDSLPMTKRSESGIWEITTNQPQEGQHYKFKVKQADGREIMKIDPYAIYFEERPGTAAVLYTVPAKKWRDGLWQGRKSVKINLNDHLIFMKSMQVLGNTTQMEPLIVFLN